MLEVRFHKAERHVWWEATRGRSRIQGAGGARGRDDLPHDLQGIVVEQALGVHGFWWAVDQGATFRSMRKKATKPGRDVIRRHAREIHAGEQETHAVWDAYLRGEPVACAEALDDARAEWRALPVGGSMVRTYAVTSARTRDGRGRGPARADVGVASR